MELQNILNQNDNLIQYFKTNNLKVVKKNNLVLLKYYYGEHVNEKWKKYCKGCILDEKNNFKILCLSPIKSELYEKNKTYTTNFTVQNLIDGTMVNVFYHNDEWNLSSRSDIGGKNRWNGHTLEYLFKQCCDYNNLTKTLNKDYSYSFVLQHKSIRNISFIDKNNITLVDKFNLNTLKSEKITDDLCVNTIEYLNFDSDDIHFIVDKFKQENSNIKGITFKFDDGTRVNYINEKFIEVKDLNVNTQNLLYKFIELKKNNTLEKYLENFKEHQKLFNNFSEKYQQMIDECVTNYHDLFIHKNIKIDQVPYQLKPIMFLINKIYINTKEYMSRTNITQLIDNLDTRRLVFIIKYYI